jgi:hypothetical protein
MCNFCHIQGNNRNSIQHFDIDCFDRRNPNSKNFDPTTLSFQEQLQLATTNSIKLEEERQQLEQLQLEQIHLQQQQQQHIHLQRQQHLQQPIHLQQQRQNQTLVHIHHPYHGMRPGEPVAIVHMGNGQGMVFPIGIMNRRYRRF